MSLDQTFLSQKFADSTITYGWLLEKLQQNDPEYKKFSSDASAKEIKYEEIGAGEGYMSKVLRVNIYCKGVKNPYSVVLKIPCVSSGIKAMMGENRELYEKFWEQVAVMHKNECNFYKKFGKYNIRMPKVYGTEEVIPKVCDGALLMEYLTNNGVCNKRGVSFTYFQVMSLANELAKLAAISLTMGKEVENYVIKPDPKMFQFVTDAVEQLLRDDTGFYGDRIKRISPLFTVDFINYFSTSINKKLGLKPVLNHGDMWGNNIMWRKDAKNESSDEVYALIDWQLIHAGTIARDLATVLVIGADALVRRQFEKIGLEIFYRLVEEKLHRLRGCPMPITFQQVLTAKPANTTNPVEVERRCQAVRQRLKNAAEDAYEILKNYFPEWLIIQNPDMRNEEQFADTPYTCEWLKNILYKQDPNYRKRQNERKIVKVEYKEVGNKDKWLTSKTLKVQIHFDDSEGPYAVLLIIPNVVITAETNTDQYCFKKIKIDENMLELASVDYIIIFGLSANNFVDGMSNGVAIADSLVRGLSVGLACIAQQFPQEVGWYFENCKV